jgi:hypothetical protein
VERLERPNLGGSTTRHSIALVMAKTYLQARRCVRGTVESEAWEQACCLAWGSALDVSEVEADKSSQARSMAFPEETSYRLAGCKAC